MTDDERDKLLLAMKRAVTNIGALLMAMAEKSGPAPEMLAHLDGIKRSIEILDDRPIKRRRRKDTDAAK